MDSLRALFEDLGGVVGAPTPPPDDAMGGIARFARLGEIATLTGMAQAAGMLEVVLGAQRMQPDGVLFRLLDSLATSARARLAERLAHDVETRRIWHVIDLALATLRGNVRFGLFADPRGFDAIDASGSNPRSMSPTDTGESFQSPRSTSLMR